MENYEKIEEIRNGAFGTIYKAQDLRNPEMFVAIKAINTHGGVPAHTLREITLLKKLVERKHPNIANLLDLFHGLHTNTERSIPLYMVFEYIERDLFTHLEQCTKQEMSTYIIKNMMRQMLSGVDFIHCNQIIHRNLQPKNLLLSKDFKIKITNFGLAKSYVLQTKLTPKVTSSLWYQAPEILLGLPYDTAIDIWACGCIMAELYKLTPLFPGDTEVQQLNTIFKIIGLPSEMNWPQNVSFMKNSFKSYPEVRMKNVIPDICSAGESLLETMLSFNCTLRGTAVEALNHPYFRET